MRVTTEDLEQAADWYGRYDRRPRHSTRTAYHEAGHVLIAYLSGCRVRSVTVEGSPCCLCHPNPQDRDAVSALALSGYEGEWMMSGRYYPPYRVHQVIVAISGRLKDHYLQELDLYKAYRAFQRTHPGRRQGPAWRAWLRERRQDVRRELTDHRPALDALAAELMQRRTLTGAQVEAIILAKLPECPGANRIHEDSPSGCPETRRTEECA